MSLHLNVHLLHTGPVSRRLQDFGTEQIPGKQGPASRFVMKAKHEPRIPKSNSRWSKKRVVRGQSIWPPSEYLIGSYTNNRRSGEVLDE